MFFLLEYLLGNLLNIQPFCVIHGMCLYLCSQAIATEGKYWKRRIEIVIREYHKWRTYFKKRVCSFAQF